MVLGPLNGEAGHFSNGLLNYVGYLGEGRPYFAGYLDRQGRPAITIYPGGSRYSTDEYLTVKREGSGAFSADGYAVLEDYRDGRPHPAVVVINTSGETVHVFDQPAPAYFSASASTVVSDGLISLSLVDSAGKHIDQVYDLQGNLLFPNESVPDFAPGVSYSPLFSGGVHPMYSGDAIFIDLQGRTIVPGVEDMLADGSGFFYDKLADTEVFVNGTSMMILTRWVGLTEVREHYLLELHEGTYTGPGMVYDALTGTIRDGGTATPDPQPSGDTPSSWAVEQVNAAISAGIVPDTLQSRYTAPATRAEFCALAVELYETVTGGEITARAQFSDTTDVNVQKMAGLGVVNGVGSGQFNPDGQLTREQAATMLARLAEAMGRPLPAADPTFADNASISSWAADAVGQMQAAGIMDGTGDNQFSPQSSYTREQSILTALRLYQSVNEN